MMTLIWLRWTSRENLLAAAGDEDGDPQLFVSLYDFQVLGWSWSLFMMWNKTVVFLDDILTWTMLIVTWYYFDGDNWDDDYIVSWSWLWLQWWWWWFARWVRPLTVCNAGWRGKPTQSEKGGAGEISMRIIMMMIRMMAIMVIMIRMMTRQDLASFSTKCMDFCHVLANQFKSC